MLGYAAEMILKHACFRVDLARPADPASGFFGPIKTWMKVHHPQVEKESYHSLLFWGYYLRSKRRAEGKPLPLPIDWELVRRVRRLYSVWSVGLRYRDWTAPAKETGFVFEDVTWLRDMRLRIWS